MQNQENSTKKEEATFFSQYKNPDYEEFYPVESFFNEYLNQLETNKYASQEPISNALHTYTILLNILINYI